MIAVEKRTRCDSCGDLLGFTYFLFRKRRTCNICRRPKGLHEILRAGVPFMTADSLYRLVRHGRVQKYIGTLELLGIVHPRLMENITVRGMHLKLVDKSLVWVRRRGWAKRKAREA